MYVHYELYLKCSMCHTKEISTLSEVDLLCIYTHVGTLWRGKGNSAHPDLDLNDDFAFNHQLHSTVS